MTTITAATQGSSPAGLGPVVAALEGVVDLVLSNRPSGDALTLIAVAAREALDADAALVAVPDAGRPTVFADVASDLDPQEARRLGQLAETSLDDIVLAGRPRRTSPPVGSVPGPEGTLIRAGSRCLVTAIRPGGGQGGTLTICRAEPFSAADVDVAMAFASLARIAIAGIGPAAGHHLQCSFDGHGIVDRLFAVGLTLHLLLMRTDDDQVRATVESAIDELDRALVDLRSRAFAGGPGARSGSPTPV